MVTEKRKLVTIVTEAALERELARELERLGAHGYTVADVRGKGAHGERNAGWDLTANIRVEVVCSAGTADAIAATLRERYYDHFAMILFIADVDVLRPQKF
jgi:nitrogen regulatory protein PII